jgi:hypothetical protein
LYGTVSNYNFEKSQDFQVFLKMVGIQLLTPYNLAHSKTNFTSFQSHSYSPVQSTDPQMGLQNQPMDSKITW